MVSSNVICLPRIVKLYSRKRLGIVEGIIDFLHGFRSPCVHGVVPAKQADGSHFKRVHLNEHMEDDILVKLNLLLGGSPKACVSLRKTILL